MIVYFTFLLFFSIIENSAVKIFSYVTNHINTLKISYIYNFFTDMEKYFFLIFIFLLFWISNIIQ